MNVLQMHICYKPILEALTCGCILGYDVYVYPCGEQTQSRTHTETFNGHLVYNKHSQGRVQKPSMDISYITNTVKDAYRNLQWTSRI